MATRFYSHTLQMGLQTRWHNWTLEGTLSSTWFYIGVWYWLCENLFPSCSDVHCLHIISYCCISSTVHLSDGCQKCFSPWWALKDCLHASSSTLLCFSTSCLSAMLFYLWSRKGSTWVFLHYSPSSWLPRKSSISLFRYNQYGLVLLLLYVHDMIIIGDDIRSIQLVKHYLEQQFWMKVGASTVLPWVSNHTKTNGCSLISSKIYLWVLIFERDAVTDSKTVTLLFRQM